MPRLIICETEDRIDLGDLVEMLESGAFDPMDEDCLASWGPALKKLANNRDFLCDLVVARLTEGEGPQRRSLYNPQVMVLHGGARNFLLRANFWPAQSDGVVVGSGTDPFFYNIPHDHNFSFLTVGYAGPGYWSDYYEYDYERVAGYAGEKVDLRFIEKSRLEEGKVLLYRAHRDVHRQLPADSMSVSLNILAIPASHEFRDQYRFDTARSEIDGIVNGNALPPLLMLAAHFGGPQGADVLDRFAASHPSDRIRFAALKAQASVAGGADERIALFAKASCSSNPFVSAMAKREAERIEASRDWIERAPPEPIAAARS